MLNLDALVERSRRLFDRPNSRFRHFSFLLAGNKVLSHGWNDAHKTHPLALWCGHRHASIHSELACILRYRGRYHDGVTGLVMVNVRLSARGDTRLARPCPACLVLLGTLGIREVHYSCDKGFRRELVPLPPA